MMRGDPAQLTQVLRNLIGNAIQAICETGEKAGVICLTASEDAGQYQLRLSDSGPGVPRNIQDKIFEPLYTTKAKGNGLGLWISRELVRGHGGELSYVADHKPPIAESDQEGAEFLVVLPRGLQKDTK
jgi:signal transduction histidine kinase